VFKQVDDRFYEFMLISKGLKEGSCVVNVGKQWVLDYPLDRSS